MDFLIDGSEIKAVLKEDSTLTGPLRGVGVGEGGGAGVWPLLTGRLPR